MADVKTLDLDDLAARVTDALAGGRPGARVSGLETLPGGTSSLTYSATVDDAGGSAPVVVKVAPPGIPPVRNRDMIRQARILEVLHDVPGVAVPAVYATDAGDPPDVPPFFVMEFVPGESIEPVGAPNDALDPATMDTRARAAMRMAAAMHRTSAIDLGLDGEPAKSPRDEVAHWERSFSSVEGDLHPPVVDECTAGLYATVPEPMTPVIMHGDWRLGNMQCVGPDIKAVIDWEIWAVGDPRVEIAWFLLMSDTSRAPHMVGNGVPSLAELQAEYERAAGRSLDAMDWFAALVRYKQAAASALIIKNALKRDPDSPVARNMGAGLTGNLAGCKRILDAL
ncbi:MAG TPA: phosphotransferase family protein [Acidimicrobiia bacterium]|jgi:aminoglycoside phosphotransferase (APT) family kinase protein